MIRKKIKILLVLISLSLTLGLMSNTYSRYVASANGSVEAVFAKWQILLNNTDITNETSSTINITPIMEENQYIKNNTVAPSSKGYFDVNIDPSNVGVSFTYSINLKVANENMPDLLITKYAILDKNYVEGDEITTTNIEANKIDGELNFDNKVTNFKFEPFTIRVYFEWYEGENEKMDDQSDTNVGKDAALNDTKLLIQATIDFKQKL